MIIYHKSIFWVALSLSFKKLENQTIIDCRRLEVWSVDWNHLEPGAPAATSRRSQFWGLDGHWSSGWKNYPTVRALSDYHRLPYLYSTSAKFGWRNPLGIIWRWPSGRFRVEVGEETKFCCIQSSLVGEKNMFCLHPNGGSLHETELKGRLHQVLGPCNMFESCCTLLFRCSFWYVTFNVWNVDRILVKLPPYCRSKRLISLWSPSAQF